MTTNSLAIIGTRDPSPEQVALASGVAMTMSSPDYRWWIVTGGADGIDTVAMDGAFEGQLEVVLPWASYNREKIPAHAEITVYNPAMHRDWAASVLQYHPNPGALTRGSRALHARNYGIVYGRDVVLALPGPNGAGGTGQGIRIATGLGIPVLQFNKGSVLPSVEELVLKIRAMLPLWHS